MTRRTGFTFIEMLIALVVGLVVLGGVSDLLVRATAAVQRSGDRLDPREQAHLALNDLRRLLRDARSYEVLDQGARLRFRSTRFTGELSCDTATGALQLRDSAGVRRLAVARLAGLTIHEMAPGLLRLELHIRPPGRAGGRAALDRARLVQEVLLPALTAQDAALPMRPAFLP